MDSRKTLYIHIGTGKTGTSAIQKYVEQNEDVLRQNHNLNYVLTGRDDSKHRSLDFNARRKLDGYVDIVCEELILTRNEILNSDCENHLISDEDFPGLTVDEIKKIAEIFAPEISIKIIVYLRRQDDYVESWFAQIVKTGAYTADINNLYERLAAGKLLDYAAMLEPWEQQFGKNALIVRPYERAQFKNASIFDDFMWIFGVVTDGLKPIKGEVNTSLTRDKILFLRKLARNGLVEIIDSSMIENLKKIETKGDSKFVLSNQKRQEIADRYTDVNDFVAKRYRGVDKLFLAPSPTSADIDWVPRSEVPDTIFLEMFKFLVNKTTANT